MSVKTNLLIAAAAVLGVSSAYAGGPEMMAAPAAPSFTPYFYGELGLGYAQTSYNDFEGVDVDATNSNGGLSYAGNFGYEFMPHLAVELGGGYLPEWKDDGSQSVTVDGTSYTFTGNLKVSSWYAYGAGRIDTNVVNDKINVYAKAGVAYRSVTDKFSGTVSAAGEEEESYSEDETNSFWAPFFGAGVSYDVRDNIYVALEMNYIGNNNDASSDTGIVPAASIYMAKVGYKFNF